jgi:Derlin-2/3
MLLFGAVCMLVVVACSALFNNVKFLGHPFVLMMVNIWSLSPENIRMSIFDIVQLTAPYLPYVILLFSLFLGNPVETDLLGIIVGRIYYFMETVSAIARLAPLPSIYPSASSHRHFFSDWIG